MFLLAFLGGRGGALKGKGLRLTFVLSLWDVCWFTLSNFDLGVKWKFTAKIMVSSLAVKIVTFHVFNTCILMNIHV